MAIRKNKEQLYKERILDCLKEHGKLAKSRISYLCRMNLYNTYFILEDMLLDGTIKRIEGIITLYDLEDKNGKKK